ncbi:MAG: lysophospholipid acyltransferase family protein [Thermodesulfobacteriota bacterium]
MLHLAYETLAALGGRLSPDGAAKAGAVLGAAMWRLLPGRRRLASEAMALHLGLDPAAAESLARLSFTHNARSFLEILLTPRLDWRFLEERVRIVSPDLFHAFTTSPRPVVVAAAHLGAWEFLTLFSRLFWPGRQRMVVVRRPRDLALHQTMLRLRGGVGIRIVEHRNAAFTVLKGLKRKGVAAFLVDHNASRDESVFLPFLGKVAAVNAGPALLAVRGGAEVWPCFLVREDGEDGRVRYAFHQQPPLDTASLEGSREEKIRQTAEFYTAAVEQAVRAHPEQWFWMHRRWKTRPPGEEGD